jgi:multimeric flavodoxin WrbA
MSKIIAFMASPRENGYSTKLIEQVIAGAKSVGAEVITYDLNNDGIKGCQGCFYCRANEGCATKDNLQSMYGEIAACDGIVASFPIYFAGINGQAKRWMDRLYPVVNADFSPRYPGKKVVSVYAQGNPDKEMFKNVIEGTDAIINRLGWNLINSLLIHGSSAPDYIIPQDLLDIAYEAGKQLVN